MQRIAKIGLLILVSGAVGCSSMSNTDRGVLGGAAIGSVAGALVGKATGNAQAGAVLGAVGGGIAGGVIGNDADREVQRKSDVRQMNAEQAYRDDQPNRVAAIVEMSKQGQDETVIVNHIKNNRMAFNLNVEDLRYLKDQSVSPRVIGAMQVSGQPVYVAAPPPRTVVVREPVYVHPPMYGPPNMVYIGGRWR